jgi:hypothetical protein
MKRRILIRSGLEASFVVVIHCALLYAMVQWRVMEVMLSPSGEQAKAHLMLTFFFVLFRGFAFFVAPGWILARLYLASTRASLAAEPAGVSTAADPPSTIETT